MRCSRVLTGSSGRRRRQDDSSAARSSSSSVTSCDTSTAVSRCCASPSFESLPARATYPRSASQRTAHACWRHCAPGLQAADAHVLLLVHQCVPAVEVLSLRPLGLSSVSSPLTALLASVHRTAASAASVPPPAGCAGELGWSASLAAGFASATGGVGAMGRLASACAPGERMAAAAPLAAP